MRRKVHRLIVIQQVLFVALLILCGLGLYIQRKQNHVISVLLDAVYTLQQLEEQRSDREAAPVERKHTDERTY